MKKYLIFIFIILLILFILSSCIKIEPDFLLNLSNPDDSYIEMIGESYTIDLIITPINGFSGNVELSLIDNYFNLDGATSMTLNIESEKKISLKIRKTDQASPGNYNIKIKASSSTITKNKNIDLNISLRDFEIKSVIDQPIQVLKNSKYDFPLIIKSYNNFQDQINLYVVDENNDLFTYYIGIEPSEIEIKNESTLTVINLNISENINIGDYNLKLIAESENYAIKKEVNFTLKVTSSASEIGNSSFDLYLSKKELTIEQGNNQTIDSKLTPLYGFTGNVNFELQSLDGTAAPAGITIVPNKVNVPSEDNVSFTMVVSVAPTVSAGIYNLRIVASDDANTINKYVYLTLEVTQLNSEADFVIQLVDSVYNSKNYFEITAGDSINTFIKITPQNDFNGDIQFNIYKYDDSSLSPDFTISPNVIHLNTTDATNPIMFTITNVSSVPGNYVVKIEASSGNTIREIFINIIVK